jgi:hypothetical protein
MFHYIVVVREGSEGGSGTRQQWYWVVYAMMRNLDIKKGPEGVGFIYQGAGALSTSHMRHLLTVHHQAVARPCGCCVAAATTTSATDARVSSVLANEISLNCQRSALVTAVAGMFYGMLRLLTVLFGWTNAAASP